jgi:hypothetical protein
MSKISCQTPFKGRGAEGDGKGKEGERKKGKAKRKTNGIREEEWKRKR